MDCQRHFGKELTNILEGEYTRYKRSITQLLPERARGNSLANPKPLQRQLNKAALEEERTRRVGAPLDPQCVPEYYLDCLQFMRKREDETYRLSAHLLEGRAVDECARGKLIDWLSELHFKFKMFPETIYSIVYIVDVTLSRREVLRNELQLLGVTALYIAAKFEETYQVPQLRQLVKCCAEIYSGAQILAMEASVLALLNFELVVNSSFKFFDLLAQGVGLEAKNYHLAQYVLELSFLKTRFLGYRPSLLAASAIYLIKKIRKGESSWSEAMGELSGYREEELRGCARELCFLLESAGELENCKSIRRKFSLPSFHEVTRIRLERRDKQ